MTYVYLVFEYKKDNFKVGYSADYIRRIKSLPQKIDLKRSYYVDCLDSSHAFEIEQSLHFLLSNSRFDHPINGYGATEWFKGYSFSAALNYLNDCGMILKPCNFDRPRKRKSQIQVKTNVKEDEFGWSYAEVLRPGKGVFRKYK